MKDCNFSHCKRQLALPTCGNSRVGLFGCHCGITSVEASVLHPILTELNLEFDIPNIFGIKLMMMITGDSNDPMLLINAQK
ncbi:hypothetical protein GBA52_012175 [Prunus armeniaca]|nr:hypothetical protein GBA52_012175 [Prunus armeniaca]